MTTAPQRRCSECGRPLPPAFGRPRLTCRDEDAPGTPTCRVRRKSRLDLERRLHGYAGRRTLGPSAPRMGGRRLDGLTLDALAEAGFGVIEEAPLDIPPDWKYPLDVTRSDVRYRLEAERQARAFRQRLHESERALEGEEYASWLSSVTPEEYEAALERGKARWRAWAFEAD